jgi:hypothetical protein
MSCLHDVLLCVGCCPQAGNKSYVGALAYAPPGFLPELENGAVISGVCICETAVCEEHMCAEVGSYYQPSALAQPHEFQQAALAIMLPKRQYVGCCILHLRLPPAVRHVACRPACLQAALNMTAPSAHMCRH